MGVPANRMIARVFVGAFLVAAVTATTPAPTATTTATGSNCQALKDAYRTSACCGVPTKVTDYSLGGDGTMSIPKHSLMNGGITNECVGKKLIDWPGLPGFFNNVNCTVDNIKNGILNVVEQSGSNVTVGYKGNINASGGYLPPGFLAAGATSEPRVPILTEFFLNNLCPVNVHWHVGTEHYSVGQFDEYGKGPSTESATSTIPRTGTPASSPTAASPERAGFRCHHYDATDAKFTTPYNWQHCSHMKVGETYEIHWPHSAGGACGTPNQYQTPFYDGVFCKEMGASLTPVNFHKAIGVQAQVFTVVNDEKYYYPSLFNGRVKTGNFWSDVAKYTGSTTGTSRDNEICSRYAPITWQVDRKCHLISASSFDKMCADMKAQNDDLSGDTHPHGARLLVADFLTANNMQRRSMPKLENILTPPEGLIYD